ncbi:hypothetical protein C2845_PM16G08270 [Panicum miliaceum]|uniref:Uncharacterized protein n=1 Tax=Panicum miliaceum TaxID=4540 RepID=A0A3L6Q0P7_PANMI|nr:hypothetical protein C2845_PM16G08270 [Panicum miliaceum]
MQRQGLSSSSWRLRRLYLSNLYLDDNFTEHVSSGCQNLEDLELKGCRCTFHEISSHSLKNKNCEFSKLSAITSPALKSLVIESYSYEGLYSQLVIITAPAVAYLLLYVEAWHFKVLGEDPVTFPNFRNLTTLFLGYCDLSDNFKTLEYFLKNSRDLERLTLRCCKFSEDLKKKKAKSKRASSSQCLNLVDVQCENLKHIEIIYKDDDVRQLVELLLSISANLPKNNIKLTKVE